MPKGPDDHINELDAEVARLREGIEEAVDLLNTPGGAGEALAVLTALIDGTESDG